MPKSSIQQHIKNNPFFVIFLLGYAVLGLVNLDRLPIAWTDEIQHLDPVFNYLKFNKFYSKIWPNPGANIAFGSYPPLITNLHLLFSQLLPNTIFFLRLPAFLAMLSTIVLLYAFLQKHSINKNKLWILVLCLAFTLDKSVFEITKSMRIEPWIWFFSTAGIYCLFNLQKPVYRIALSAIAGILLLAHLYIWPVVIFWFFLAVIKNKSNPAISYIIIVLVFLLPAAITFAWMPLSISNLFQQLLYQSAKHGSDSNIFWQLFQYFWGKFYPYYIEQPATPLIFFFTLYVSIKALGSTQTHINKKYIILSFLLLLIPQAFILSPHIRYFGTHWLFSIVIISQCISPQRIQSAMGNSLNYLRASYLMYACIGLLTLSFLIRHTVAFYQRDDRNPNLAFSFLNRYFLATPYPHKTVIFGEPIVDYYAVNRTDIEFGLAFYPEHWEYQPTNTKYFVFHKAPPENLPFLTVLDSTGPPQNQLPDILKKLGRAHTYRNIYLYQINTKTQWDSFFSPTKMEEINGK